jgi:hypothetical protein
MDDQARYTLNVFLSIPIVILGLMKTISFLCTKGLCWSWNFVLSMLSLAASVSILVFASRDTKFESDDLSLLIFHVPLGLSTIFPSVFEVSHLL